MRISDWSSDVCSSDLQYQRAARGVASEKRALRSFEHLQVAQVKKLAGTTLIVGDRVGRHRHLGEVDDDTGAGTELRTLAADVRRFDVARLACRLDGQRGHAPDRKSTRLNSSP